MTILLFPGSFSPFTDGHYSIINRYLEDAKRQGIKIDKVLIIMSPLDREGIKASSIFKFIRQVYSNDNRVEAKISKNNSPIRDAYEFAQNLEEGELIFLRSNKDEDNVADGFNKAFSEGGKYYKPSVKIVDFKANETPIVYKSRQDKYQNTPISASVAREDLRNKDFNSFLANYQIMLRNNPAITEKHIKYLYEALVKQVQPSK